MIGVEQKLEGNRHGFPNWGSRDDMHVFIVGILYFSFTDEESESKKMRCLDLCFQTS